MPAVAGNVALLLVPMFAVRYSVRRLTITTHTNTQPSHNAGIIPTAQTSSPIDSGRRYLDSPSCPDQSISWYPKSFNVISRLMCDIYMSR
ncbi:hypothetical protein BR93DRAFT_330045 [Coniochaeta sp. PMI_546]|nr:hypothetical protein BR93DRAFT_330045 [Coniochaeta sp. PMI_546]